MIIVVQIFFRNIFICYYITDCRLIVDFVTANQNILKKMGINDAKKQLICSSFLHHDIIIHYYYYVCLSLYIIDETFFKFKIHIVFESLLRE